MVSTAHWLRMESASSTAFSFTLRRSLSTKLGEAAAATAAGSGITRRARRPSVRVSALSYRKFIQFALDETALHTHLTPSPLQESFSSMKPLDDKTEIELLSYKAPKIRLLRSLSIQGSKGLQVLDFAMFPEPEYDLPIFCANFFTAAETNIVVLDLNPLYDVIKHKGYKDKYYEGLMSLGLKYAELLPWGGKLTGESLRFFSPIVIWTRFESSQHMHDVLYSAFVDYLKAWLLLMDRGIRETDASHIIANCEAQHRYLTWRAEKDPGYQVLKRLIGETHAKNVVRSFLFDGVDSLGSKTFLDYFPEYRCEEGRVNEKRSMIGKSFATRPWNPKGEFIGNHND
ncbi:phytochromobilin:ferredoxin oxidoreductase, chloroplastic isoform X1 [Rhodamnia argentea]|uniref:Phytochromobilin:ferredoxin oxidoreductase, chloroplastic isoform X1 n=1 Tax=Rhodamnia argentea TaxID=178133 RepID=A0ABM3HT37_9MYRT|nr:phytochromobilin:ferredoxin oxidoreductase, chloroplastic isoform X1 [Rhodamnia argentea]